tara:strand:+ start:2264 stop:2653 length:390 start_codon:yes stop_codon:yes gene_type:complete
MAATVLTGTIPNGGSFSYTNNTGGNLRFIVYLLSAGYSDGSSAAGTFRIGGSGNDGVQWTLYETTNVGKYVANGGSAAFPHGFASTNEGEPFPVEFVIADGHSVNWNPPTSTNWFANPKYNFLVIPENA